MLNFWKDVKRGAIAFLPLWCLLLAAILWLIGFHLDGKIQNLCYGIASAVLSSGVFAAILKAFQFTSLFRDELSKVLFAESGWLSDLHPQQFQAIWKNMITAAVKKSLPDITDTLSAHILEEMMPIAQGHYYLDMSRDMTLTKYNAETSVITLQETYKVKIRPQDVSTEIEYIFSMSGIWASEQQEPLFEVNSLYINGKDYKDSVKTVGKPGDENASVGYSIKLKGAHEYVVNRHITRSFRLRSDPVLHMVATRYTKSMTIEVRNTLDNQIKTTMYPIAVKTDSITHEEASKNVDRWIARGLILPRQGIMLVFTENSSKESDMKQSTETL